MKKRRAFTIVELVIVIAVVAILAAVLIPTFSSVVRKAKDSYIFQNDRNELLQNYLESVLEGEEWTTTEKEVSSETENEVIKTLKEELSDFLSLVEQHVQYEGLLGGSAVHYELLGKEGYRLVGFWGSGIGRVVFSYGEKYNITFVDGFGHISFVKIRLYDDINTSSGESVYYGLKANEDGIDESGNTKYKIEVVKYVEPQN